MKPLIGITMNLEVQPARNLNIIDQDYAKAVLLAGGLPVPIIGIEASIRDMVKRLDGFVFTGGDDINPRYYKEKILPASKMTISPDGRTEFELRLFRAAVKARKPILAICHGAQLVNVAFGGSLYQDIPLQIPHATTHGATKPGEKIFHPVDIIEGTRLFEIMRTETIPVRSSHHQCVKKAGKGLKFSALSRDGIMEALESRTSYFLVAVQWHPEKTNDRYTKKLFKSLVQASRR